MQEPNAPDGANTKSEEISVKDWQVQAVNILVLGDDIRSKAGFAATFIGSSLHADPTSEFAFKKLLTIDDNSYVVNIHTDSGFEGVFGFFDLCMRHGEAAVFVYSIYSRETFLMFESVRERLALELDYVPIAIVATPDPGEDNVNLREVSTLEGKKLAESCGGVFYEFETDDEKEQEKIVNSCMHELVTRITRQKSGGFLSEKVNSDKNDQKKYAEFEVVVCGDTFVGKTQLIRQLVELPFQPNYIATFDKAVHKHKGAVQDVGFILKIVDVGGLDIEAGLTKKSLMTAQGIMLVYSVTSRDSFLALEGIRKRIQMNKTETRIPVILVANKIDLADARQVTTEEGKALAKKWSCQYFETTATTAQSDTITECFQVLITDIEHAHSHAPALDSISELDRQGYLTKEGNKFKARHRRYFILKDNTISYSNEIGQPTKGSLLLTENASVDVIVHDSKSATYDFVVTSGDEKVTLGAATEVEREAWVASIKANLAVSDTAMSLLDEVMRMMLWETCAKMSEVFRRRLMGGDNLTPNSSPRGPGEIGSPVNDLDERTKSAYRMASPALNFSILNDTGIGSPPKLNKSKSGFFRTGSKELAPKKK